MQRALRSCCRLVCHRHRQRHWLLWALPLQRLHPRSRGWDGHGNRLGTVPGRASNRPPRSPRNRRRLKPYLPSLCFAWRALARRWRVAGTGPSHASLRCRQSARSQFPLRSNRLRRPNRLRSFSQRHSYALWPSVPSTSPGAKPPERQRRFAKAVRGQAEYGETNLIQTHASGPASQGRRPRLLLRLSPLLLLRRRRRQNRATPAPAVCGGVRSP